MAKKVSVIVLNYNGRKLLERFLPSVTRLEYNNYELIVWDNGSSDGSVEFIKTHFPKIRIGENEKNLGTAEGSNLGAKFARGEYLLWLGNDMDVDPKLIDELVRAIESDFHIGACGCKILKLDEHDQNTSIIDTVGFDLDLYGFPSPRGINEVDKGQWNHKTEVFFLSGCGLFMRRSVFEKIGGFDPGYFTLGDDVDLCWRVHLAGYKIIVNPSAVIYHKVSGTLRTFRRSRIRYLSERNTLTTLLKNYSLSTLTSIIPGYAGLLLAEIIYFIIRGKFSLALADIRALWWNLKKFRRTWLLHEFIQQHRVITDDTIQRQLIKKPVRITTRKLLANFLSRRELALKNSTTCL